MKVILIGNSGAGKSTLARRLVDATGWPSLSLDKIWHSTDFSQTAKIKFAETQKEFMATHANWIIDGNYNGTMAARLNAAELIILCQVSRPVALFRVIRRSVRFHRDPSTRPDMPADFSEHFDRQYFQFLLFIWRYPARVRRELQPKLNHLRPNQKLAVVRTGRQKDDLVQLLTASAKK